MMLTAEDKKALELQGEDFFIEAECFFDRPFERPTYLFNQRGKAAGSALLQRNLIKINPVLFNNNKQEFFQQVIPHEVAHLIAYQVYGKVRPHGKEWQHIMQVVFNRPALTTHQLDIKDVVGKLFTYQCACTSHQLTIRRHNKVQKGAEYRCRACQSALIYTPTG